jgi:DNA-binding NtrC family response regulator
VTTAHLVPARPSPPSSNEPIVLAASMIEAVNLADAFAPAATAILLFGETGVGKTFIARYIHARSGRPDGFHDFSLGTVASTLVADELFGHVPWAFTDARKERAGRIATAGRGTLLLDDVHTGDLDVQKKLLQVADCGKYTAVGCDRVQTAVCRLIFAMTQDPDVLMRRGVLLEDLRYRFGECAIWIPPLRERRGEIPLHAQRALERCAERTKLDGPSGFTDAAMGVLCEGEYAGNLRQLEGIVLRAYQIARHRDACEIDVTHLPPLLTGRLHYRRHGDLESNRSVVERALRITGGNIKKAAEIVGVSRSTVNACIAKGAPRERRSEVVAGDQPGPDVDDAPNTRPGSVSPRSSWLRRCAPRMGDRALRGGDAQPLGKVRGGGR